MSFAAKPQPDRSHRFVGTVVPRRAGVPVAVYRGLPDGSREVVGRGTTTGTGQYSVRARFADAGMSFFVATAGGTADNRQGTSRAVAVAVQPYEAPRPVVAQAPTAAADVDCGDFSTEREAQEFFDRYFPSYGDIARLDRDGDRRACESLP